MTKRFELRPDRTAVIDGKLRGVFREIVSGKSLNAMQSQTEVRRMSNERTEIITSRNAPPPRPKK
jgi:hypothetical protein